MKNWQLAVLVGALVLVFGGPPAAKALSNPIRDLKNVEVSCTETTPVLIAPTGGASSMCIQNENAGQVRIGGSGVTASNGLQISATGHSGKVFCADMTRAWCISESGTVVVDVVYGVN